MAEIPKVAVLLETSRAYGRRLVRGIVRYARLHDPWVLQVSAGHFEQELPKMKAWGGTGIIARISSPRLARQIMASGVPAIVLEASFEELATIHPKMGLCEIRSDSPKIARMAADHLMERGFRQFAYCGIPNCLWSRVREETIVRHLELNGFQCDVYRHPTARRDREWEREQAMLAGWLGRLPTPVALMAANDDRGRKVLQAGVTAGLQVPEDIAVVGVDDDDLVCELSAPPLSSVALDLEGAGYQAAELLDGLMSGRIEGFHELLVDPLWVVTRRSTDVVAQGDRDVATSLAFIRDNAHRPIGVTAVVNQTDLSRRALERRFTQAVGRTIREEIVRCRLERAKRLLLQTELPTHRVAEASGFGNFKPMARAFRREEDVSPGEFRRRHTRA